MNQKGIGTGAIIGVIFVIIAGVFGYYLLVVNPRAKSNGITPPSEFTQTNQYSQGGHTYTSYSGNGTIQYTLNTFFDAFIGYIVQSLYWYK